MPASKPTTQFPCARCGVPIFCWRHRAGKSVCTDCLSAIRSENGKRRAAMTPPPPVGTTKVRTFRGRSYRVTYRPDHPNTPKGGWMMEHRLVMEATIGRLLQSAEVVHHINHDSLDNRPDNLELCASKGRHLAAHHSADGVAARMAGYPSCSKCGSRTAYGRTVCAPCERQSMTCPTCNRPGRKMATRQMCHGCYKQHRINLGRLKG